MMRKNPGANLAAWILFHHIEWHNPTKILRGTGGSESVGNEHTLLWPTLSEAWHRLKGRLEKELQDRTSNSQCFQQCGNMVLLCTQGRVPRCPISTVPSPAAFLSATLGA